MIDFGPWNLHLLHWAYNHCSLLQFPNCWSEHLQVNPRETRRCSFSGCWSPWLLQYFFQLISSSASTWLVSSIDCRLVGKISARSSCIFVSLLRELLVLAALLPLPRCPLPGLYRRPDYMVDLLCWCSKRSCPVLIHAWAGAVKLQGFDTKGLIKDQEKTWCWCLQASLLLHDDHCSNAQYPSPCRMSRPSPIPHFGATYSGVLKLN